MTVIIKRFSVIFPTLIALSLCRFEVFHLSCTSKTFVIILNIEKEDCCGHSLTARMGRYFWINHQRNSYAFFTSFCFTSQLFTTILILSCSPLNTSIVWHIGFICVQAIYKTFKQFTYHSLLLFTFLTHKFNFLTHKFNYSSQSLNNLRFRVLFCSSNY